MVKFKIAETKSFVKNIEKSEYKLLYDKIVRYIYPILRINPFFGHNIKKLKGRFKEYYRFRIGDYRLLYKIENEKVIVFILDLVRRKDAY